MLGILGALVMGGEAYVTFKPDLVDAAGSIADESTRGFLQAFVDQFAGLLQRPEPAQRAAA
jgi:chromate reductase